MRLITTKMFLFFQYYVDEDSNLYINRDAFKKVMALNGFELKELRYAMINYITDDSNFIRVDDFLTFLDFDYSDMMRAATKVRSVVNDTYEHQYMMLMSELTYMYFFFEYHNF